MMSSSVENIKFARIVEIFNPDGTITTYPSIHNAMKSLGKRKDGAGLYIDVARGKGRFVDIMIPVEVVNEDGTRDTYQSINEVAKILGITTMEVHTMIATGKVRLGSSIRKVLTKPVTKRKSMSTRCAVEVPNEDGTIRIFGSIREATKVLGCRNYTAVYIMAALGKARLIYRAKEEEEEEEKEEVFYDALDQQEWMGEKEEKFYDTLFQREWEGTLKPPTEFFKIISLMVKTLING